MELAEARITERLRGCMRLPELPQISRKGARQISADQWGGEVFELEVMYNDRNFFVTVRSEQGAPWAIQGDVIPDPCTDDVLALTEDDVSALNTQGLPWVAAMSPEMTGRTAWQLGVSTDAVPPRIVLEEQEEEPENATTRSVPRPRPMMARRVLGPAVVGGVTLPDNYDATDRYIEDYPCKAFNPRDQGACGTCTHFTITSVFNAKLCMNSGRTSNTNILMSPRQLSDCVNPSNRGCPSTGYGTIPGNLDYYVQTPPKGREEWCIPYKTIADVCDTDGCPLSRTFPATGVKAMNVVELMQAELLLNGPIAMSIMAHNSIFAYLSGVYTVPAVILPNSWVGGHTMMLVGWGTDNATGIPFWRLQNSWGRQWGDKGYIRIRRGTNECDIETREIKTLTPLPSLECPVSPCANGSITLSDCTCLCTGAVMGGPLCDTVVNQCQNGGRLDRWKLGCLCPTGMYGSLCEYGFKVAEIDTAACSGVAKSIRIPYVIDTALDYRSTIALYTLTQTNPFSVIASARVCSAPGPCPLSGNVTLTIASTVAAGWYRIIMSPSDSTGGMYNFNGDTRVTAYYTILINTACSSSQLSAARLLNARDIPIVAAETAELDAVAQAKPRLDAASIARAQLVSQGVPYLTYKGALLGSQDVWINTPWSLCFYVPPYLNQDKKNKVFEIRQQNVAWYTIWTNQYKAINFTANASAVSPNTACFTGAISSGYTLNPYNIAMLTTDGIEYAVSAPFNTRYIEMKHNGAAPIKTALLVAITISWNIKVGTPMAFDTIQVRSVSGTNAAAPVMISNATKLNQLGSFQIKLTRLPAGQTQGPYAAYYYRGNSSEPTAWNWISGIVWANYNL